MTERHPARTLRRAASLAAAAPTLAAATLFAAHPATAAATTHVVTAGHSIQRAVNAARPGDTIRIEPGTYRENVMVTVPRLTIRGAGAQKVILEPPARAATGKAATACFTPDAGICVAGTQDSRLAGVRIEGLTVSGFGAYGIAATRTDRLTVAGVAATDNKKYGIAAQESVRENFVGDAATGNGVAGIFLANDVSKEAGALDLQGAHVAGNALTGNGAGTVLRRVRDVTVEGNAMSGNCAGMYIVGDENLPKAGHLEVRGNVVASNTRYCAATTRLPFVQGAGIVLTGVEDTVVERNTVTGNTGTSVMSGGIVLFRSFAGVTNTANTIRDNELSGNAPADLADRDTGTGNTFSGNSCSVSQPAGHC